ncbi:MAG: glycosyl transferase family 2 [Candidatus Thermoplasmatota archaeon]
MQQKWNKDLELDQKVIDQCDGVGPVDIAVGVLGKNVETTILNVLKVVNEGLYRYFPNLKKAIIVSTGASTDSTDEAVGLFQPYENIEKIVTNDIAPLGKGAGVKTIFEIAHRIQAKCVVLMDGDLLSIRPGWIETIANPIVYGRADLTVPYYIRDKNDGVITNNLVYPFTRALYGIDIRQPIAGEFALSKNLYEKLRDHPLFPPGFGIDIFIVTSAAAEGMYVKEGMFSLKIHESTTHYLEPEKFLIPMFRRVTSSMFELADYYEDYWKSRLPVWRPKYCRESFSRKPIPVKVDISSMEKSFQTEYHKSKQKISEILDDDLMKKLESIVNENQDFDPESWCRMVYNYASYYKKVKNDKKEKYFFLDTLKTLWLGRFVSYAKKVEDMDINQAEKVIQRQAKIFEDNFDLLLTDSNSSNNSPT